MPTSFNKNYFIEVIKEEFLDRRLRAITENKLHNEYVCLIASNFYGQSELVLQTGFKTILLEPLFNVEDYNNGIQCKNFDIMLHNSLRKRTIFFEIKTRIDSMKEILSEFEKATKVVYEKFDEKIARKLNLKLSEHNSIEFVLVVPRDQSLEIKNEIYKNEIKNIIIWDIDPITSPTMGVKHDVPYPEERLRLNQTHLDKEFREILYKGIFLKKQVRIFNFLLNSDPFEKANYFLLLLKNTGLEQFNFLEFSDRIFDGERVFLTYDNPQKAKEWVFESFIKELEKINWVEKKKPERSILENRYNLTADKRVGEMTLKNRFRSAFKDAYINEKRDKIKEEADDRYNKYHGQKIL